MRLSLLRHLLPAALVALTFSAQAQEWTRFRGPNGSGLAKANLPEQLAEKDINWRCALPGTGHSSPVIWGDRIFVTATPAAAPDAEAKRHRRLRRREGREKCSGSSEYRDRHLPQTRGQQLRERLHAPSMPGASMLWFARAGHEPASSSRSRRRTARSCGKKISVRSNPSTEPGASPIVEKGAVILQSSQDEPGSFIGAWDAASGRQLWKNDTQRRPARHLDADPARAGQSGPAAHQPQHRQRPPRTRPRQRANNFWSDRRAFSNSAASPRR